jgi:hypothetical protein
MKIRRVNTNDSENIIDLKLELIHETQPQDPNKGGFLVNTGFKDTQVWLPKSIVQRNGKTFTLPEWLAISKGLV